MLVQDYFARSRAQFPDKTAITYRDTAFSYEDVGRFADAVTTLLAERGYANTRVGFWMRRSPDAVASILGILGSYGVQISVGRLS